jgi:hypothetical protein
MNWPLEMTSAFSLMLILLVVPFFNCMTIETFGGW